MIDFEPPERIRRYLPLLAWAVVAFVLLAIPLKIIGYGYLPGDDALRHAAKAISGKPWPEILVVGNNFKIDHNLGWHGVLAWVHQLTGWEAEGLVVFSVVTLFSVVNLAMLPWRRRPEAWLVALLTAMIISDVPQRFTLGRPFLLTITVLMTALFASQRLAATWRLGLLFTGLFTACTFVHGVWYLWLLPLAAFLMAGQYRWLGLLGISWLAGTVLAALFTGHPVDYIWQAVSMAVNSVGLHATIRTEAQELQPFGGDILAVIVLGALVALRSLPGGKAPALTRNPAFWLACGCWLLGFRVSRFWEDWGWPALMVLVTVDVEWLLEARLAADSFRRLILVLVLALATFLSVTSDLDSRWTHNLTWQYLSTKEHPELDGWMPEHNGILYSVDMSIFYQTFFKNPHGDWRYIAGYEPALMPAEDFKVYQSVLWNLGDAKAYAPWVAKMNSADRLVIRGDHGSRPNLPELEWNYGVSGIWIGRTFRTNSLPSPAAGR